MLLQALTEKDQVEAFVADAQTTLGKAATSIEEIGSARQAAKALVAALPHIMDCRRRVDDKNRLLKAMATAGNLTGAGQAVDMTEVDNAWDSFTSQLQQHDTHLDEQKNQLQGQLARQVTELSLLLKCVTYVFIIARMYTVLARCLLSRGVYQPRRKLCCNRRHEHYVSHNANSFRAVLSPANNRSDTQWLAYTMWQQERWKSTRFDGNVRLP